VLLIGTNNHGCTAQQICHGIEAIIDAVRDKQKDAYILVLVGPNWQLLLACRSLLLN